MKASENFVFWVALVICDNPSWKHGVAQLSWEIIRTYEKKYSGQI
jgi:hypothetical protein